MIISISLYDYEGLIIEDDVQFDLSRMTDAEVGAEIRRLAEHAG
jgi:hypothetical protein